MVSNCFVSRRFLNRIAIAASALALLALPYAAQAQSGPAVEGGQQYSSSTDWNGYLTDYDFDAAPGASASAQYGQQGNNRYPDYTSRWSHMAIELGAGAVAPIGNDVSGGRGVGLRGYDTWGYTVAGGAGWNFTKHLGTLIEYRFDRNKIPGATLHALGQFHGNINTWSLTLDPIVYLPLTHTKGAYVTGGGGFYRKVTNFTAPQLVTQCYFFCYQGYANETTAHFSSNQGGLNIGAGLYWKAFGADSNTKLYAEARYEWVDSPALSSPTIFNGEGTEGLIPVTLGIRF